MMRSKIFKHATLIALSLMMAFPLVWMAASSQKEGASIRNAPMKMPETWSLDPFKQAWEKGDLGHYFWNSIFVTGMSVAGVLAVGSLAGFALARFPLRGSGFMRGLLVIGLLLPVEGILIPLHSLVEQLSLNQSRWALILPYIAIELPISTFLFHAFYLGVPRELEEAARMDGCGSWGLYWRIFLPMGRQVIGVVSVLSFLSIWNEFLLATFLVSDQDLQTMPAGFNNFYGAHRENLQLIFAGLTIYVLPAVAFYMVMSRAIAKSVTAGAVKG